MPEGRPNRLIIGISGAPASSTASACWRCCATLPVETHLVMTKAAEVTLAHETELKVAEVKALADAPCHQRHGAADLLGLVPHPGHGDRAVLDPQHVARSPPAPPRRC